MENRILGLHHITAIADNARRNHDFYTRVLGLRLVKKTVNFDDPGTYHFYFGDEKGTPGTILTFFPWEGIGQGHTGTGMATEIGYSVPAGSMDFWAERFKSLQVKHGEISQKWGETSLPFKDPDGLDIRLIAVQDSDNRKPWLTGEINAEVAVRGFHSITLLLKEAAATASVLTDIMGYRLLKQDGNQYRFVTDAVENAAIVDIVESPDTPAGKGAAGTNHHVAFRVQNEEVLMAFREKIAAKGISITPKIDRDYFFSLYFREPGGVLFELATDNPGFDKDEAVHELGSQLKLPRQYESSRAAIEQHLPKLN